MSQRLRPTLPLGLRLLLGLALLLAAPAANAASPDANVPDTWVLDSSGRVSGAYNVGAAGWTESAAEVGPNIEVTISGGGTATVSADFGQDSVLVNESPQSYPNPTAGSPPFSIVGLGAVLGSAASPGKTAVDVDLRTPDGPLQNPDTTDQTVEVLLQAIPSPQSAGDLANLELFWSINGGPTQSNDASEDPRHTFFLARNLAYTVEVWARQGGGATESDHVLWNVTIAGADDLRDSDGDGLPDLFESEFDFDPLSTDTDRDKDENGVPDFVDTLCDSGLGFADATLDTDGDEKTDCEEALRGTNPNDVQLHYPDRPVNGSFYQVEYLLDGQVFADDAETTPQTDLARVLVSTPGSALRYDTRGLPNDIELAALGLTQLDLPVHLQADLIKVALIVGDIPNQARVAPDQSLVVLAYSATNGPAGDKWVARGWIDAASELRPAVVTPVMIGLGTTWTTGADWLSDYVAYLTANLVKSHTVNLSPTTGLGVSLLESAAAYYAQLSVGATIVFGDPLSPDTPDAVRAIQQVIGKKIDPNDGTVLSPGRSLDDLRTELQGIAQPGELAAAFAASVAGYYADTASFPQRDTLRAAAALLQGDPADDDAVARYIPRLLTRMTLAELEALPQNEYDALVDPAGDADGDGVSNQAELEEPPPTGSDPLLADTDGDGHTDDYDPCPASFENTCLLVAYQTMDSDGDGVVDSIDNCMNTANPDQIDQNEDGLGDACLRYASIEKPTSNLKVFAGTSIDFTSRDGNMILFQPPLAYAWDFDGAAAPSTLADPGAIVFSTPGDYDVSLVVTEDGGAGQSTPEDLRKIVVVLSAPLPTADAGGTYLGVEGQSVVFAGTGTAGSGVVTDYDWTFGDGGIGTGTTPSHVYTDSGIFTATLTVRDSGNNTGSDDATALVFDSVPQAAFSANPETGLGPLQVQFTDLSTAYDGIASQTWTWDDGQPDGSGASPTHVFTAPGTYDVELRVTDTDGSVSVTTQAITVVGQLPALDRTGTVLTILAMALAGTVALRRGRRRVTRQAR